MILEEFDAAKGAVIDPEWGIKQIENFPDVTISCFSGKLFERVLSFFEPKELGGTMSSGGRNPIYEVTYEGERFALFQSHVGEPKCIMDYEEFLAMGSKCLILFGTCGVLNKEIEDCGIIIPTKAIRDEGCSYHYAPASDMINVNHKYVDLFQQVLEEKGYGHVMGTTWTTDACYRETRKKVERRKAQGAICVDMECAGMQALCDFRDTEFFQFFYGADNLDHSEWQPRSLSGGVRLDEKSRIALLAFELGLKIKGARKLKKS